MTRERVKEDLQHETGQGSRVEGTLLYADRKYRICTHPTNVLGAAARSLCRNGHSLVCRAIYSSRTLSIRDCLSYPLQRLHSKNIREAML